tara:strand:- start:13 stop:1152 length:1140 start_codon:yes stop_codon:yes gene_type:complete
MNKVLLILIIGLFMESCSRSNEVNVPHMPDSQKNLLKEQFEKSFDLDKSIAEDHIKKAIQKEKILGLDFLDSDFRSTTFKLPASIETPRLVETENYFYIYNIILSKTGKNIVRYDKSGTNQITFGKKGRGPGEFTAINSISEHEGKTYVFDNGSLKKLDQNLEEIERKFLRLWTNNVIMNKKSYDLKLSNNKVFPFPIANVDYETDSINFSIKDSRPGAFNFTSPNGTTFFSNDSIIVYTKTTSNIIHIISKNLPLSVTHIQLESEIIRKNESILNKKTANKEKFFNFMNSLFLIEKLHINKGTLWISFVDRKDSEAKNYLGKINLKDIDKFEELEVKIYTAPKFLNSFNFYGDHLFFNSVNMNISEYKLFQVQLDKIQ